MKLLDCIAIATNIDPLCMIKPKRGKSAILNFDTYKEK